MKHDFDRTFTEDKRSLDELQKAKPSCYRKMKEMKPLIEAKCRTCNYKVDCLLRSFGMAK